MNVLRRSAFVTLIFLLHFEPIRSAVSVGEEENPKVIRGLVIDPIASLLHNMTVRLFLAGEFMN